MDAIFKPASVFKYHKFVVLRYKRSDKCYGRYAQRQFVTVEKSAAELLQKNDAHKKNEQIVKDGLATIKARLLYQSRKRGMLENGLLLSTFAHKYLASLSPQLTHQYDELINGPSNDWDIYYWLTGKQPIPKEYDNEIMGMLRKHVKNESCEQRFSQPDLTYDA